MTNFTTPSIQHCLTPEEFVDYATMMRVLHHVVIEYNEGTWNDELTISGTKVNVKAALITFYGGDNEQAEYNCPELF